MAADQAIDTRSSGRSPVMPQMSCSTGSGSLTRKSTQLRVRRNSGICCDWRNSSARPRRREPADYAAGPPLPAGSWVATQPERSEESSRSTRSASSRFGAFASAYGPADASNRCFSDCRPSALLR